MCASLCAGEEVDSFCFISILNHGISHQGRMIHSKFWQMDLELERYYYLQGCCREIKTEIKSDPGILVLLIRQFLLFLSLSVPIQCLEGK